MAKRSVEYSCPSCGPVADLVPKVGSVRASGKKSRFQAEIQKLHELQVLNEAKTEDSTEDTKVKEQAATTTNNGHVHVQDAQDVKTKANVDVDDEGNAKASTSTDGRSDESKEATAPVESVIEIANNKKATAKEEPTATETVTRPSTISSLAAADGATATEATATRENPSSSTGEATSTLPVDVPDERCDSFITDPIVHGILVCFIAIIAILFRKIQLLLADLKALDETSLS
jgi:hypothetical protein